MSSGGRPAAQRASAPPAVVRRPSLLDNNDGGGAETAKVKAVHKSKSKTPADLVRQTRDLLVVVDRGGADTKESKRDEKVCIGFLLVCFHFFIYFLVVL